MESRVLIEISIEEFKVSVNSATPPKLQITIDKSTKEYSHPYKDIFFQITKFSQCPKLRFNIINEELKAEGLHTLPSLKVSEKIRVQLNSDQGIAGHIVMKVFCIENSREELCRHCELLEEIISHSSKGAVKLSEFEDRPLGYNLGLELNIKHLEDKESQIILDQKDIKYIKSLLIGAHEKIKTYEIIAGLKQSTQENTKSTRTTKVIDYSKIITALEQKISKQNQTIEQLNYDHKNTVDLYVKERDSNKSTLGELEVLQLESNIFKGEMVKTRTNKRKSECLAGTLDDLAQRKSQAELELAKLKDIYQKSIAEFGILTKGYDETITKLIEEKEFLENTKDKMASQIKELKSKNDNLSSLIAALKSEISEKTARIDAFENYYKESAAEKIIKENLANLYDQIEANRNKSSELAKLMRKDKSDLFSKNFLLLEQIKDLSTRLDGSDSIIKQNEIVMEEKSANINVLRHKLQANQIEKNFLNDLNDLKSHTAEFESSLLKNIDILIKFTVDLSQKYLFQQRLITKIFKYVQDKDCEICILRNKIIDEQSGLSIYIPEKTDNIDMAMADYVNTRPTFLEVPFVRVEKGVYLFGSKIVKVKLQNNRLIMCLGGGFMSIDEFIVIFTPPEIEKMTERKKYDQATEMKGAVNESLSFLSCDGGISPIEHSPVIRKPRKEQSMNPSVSFKTQSNDTSVVLSTNPLANNQNQIKRSMTRKNSAAPKY